MPFHKVIDPKTGELKEPKELQKYFHGRLGRLSNVVTTCGTGTGSYRGKTDERGHGRHPVPRTRTCWIHEGSIKSL